MTFAFLTIHFQVSVCEAQECRYVNDPKTGKRLDKLMVIDGNVMSITSLEKSKDLVKKLTQINSLENKNKLLEEKLSLKELKIKILEDRLKTLMIVKTPLPEPEVKFFKSPYTTFVMGAVFSGVMFGYWACMQGDKVCIQR